MTAGLMRAFSRKTGPVLADIAWACETHRARLQKAPNAIEVHPEDAERWRDVWDACGLVVVETPRQLRGTYRLVRVAESRRRAVVPMRELARMEACG